METILHGPRAFTIIPISKAHENANDHKIDHTYAQIQAHAHAFATGSDDDGV